MKEHSADAILTILFIVAAFFVLLILNLKTPYIADDFAYKFFFQGSYPEPGQRVINTLSIPQSMMNHYQIWNGRIVAHSVAQFFMQFPSKVPFDIANSLVYLGMMWLILLIIGKVSHLSIHLPVVVLLFFYLWFFIPAFGQTVLWLSGSCNYLWMSLIYLGFIYFIISTKAFNLKTAIIAVVLGVLTGAANENSSLASLCIVLMIAVVRLFKNKKIDWNAVLGVAFGIAGFLFVVFSPGLKSGLPASNGFQSFQHNMARTSYLFTSKYLWIYLGILLLLLVGWKAGKIDVDSFILVVIFMIGQQLALFMMMFATDFPIRSLFGSDIFLAIGLFIVVQKLIGDLKVPWTVPALIAAAAIFALSFDSAYQSIDTTEGQVSRQVEIIQHAKKHHKKSATVPLYPEPTNKHDASKGTLKLLEEEANWVNVWEAQYYNIDSISGRQ